MSDLHLELDLDFDGGSLDGRLRDDDGSVRRFQGWLGLIDALERLRPGAGSNATTTRRDADSTAVKAFMLIHRHSPAECTVAHAAWSGFDSPLRGLPVPSTCARHQPLQSARDAGGPVGHEIWWTVQAEDSASALTLLPPYVAERTEAREVTEVTIG